MSLYLMTNWWITLPWEKQAFWSLAIVSSILLGILFLSALLEEEEEEKTLGKKADFITWLDSRFILVFFTGMGWSGLILFHNAFSLSFSIIWSVIFGLLVALLIRWLDISGRGFRKSKRPQIGAIFSTGEALQSIPPHRNGFGKVQISDRQTRYTVDAITAGGEIPRGAPVRVIDIIDDKVILVEPIEPQYPGQRV